MCTVPFHALRAVLVVLALAAFAVLPASADGKGGGGKAAPDGKDEGGKATGGKKKDEEAAKAAEAVARKLAECLECEKSQFRKFHECNGSVLDKLLCLARMLADRRARFATEHADLISQARGATGAEKAELVAKVRALWTTEVEEADSKAREECKQHTVRIEESERRAGEHRADERREGGGGTEIGGGVDGKGRQPPPR